MENASWQIDFDESGQFRRNAVFFRLFHAIQWGMVVVVLWIIVSASLAFAQRLRILTLDEISDLIKSGVSSSRIAQLVEKNGVGFELDEAALRRLRQDGASDAVVSTVRKMAARYAEEKQRRRRLAEEQRRVEEAKQQKAELERQKQEEARKRKEEAMRKLQEEARRREEERTKLAEVKRQKAELERKKQQEARQLKEEADRKLQEEARQKEEERRQIEETRLRLEEKRKNLRQARRREEEITRKPADEKTKITQTAVAPPCLVGSTQLFRLENGRRFTRAIRAYNGGICEINRSGVVASFDKDWTLTKIIGAGGAQVPKRGLGSLFPYEETVGEKWMPFPLQVGNTWNKGYSATVAGGSMSVRSYFTVLTQEDVTVSAGNFRAFKIKEEIQRLERSGPGAFRRGVRYLWYVPEVGYFVKTRIAPDESSGGWSWPSNSADFELISWARPVR